MLKLTQKILILTFLYVSTIRSKVNILFLAMYKSIRKV